MTSITDVSLIHQGLHSPQTHPISSIVDAEIMDLGALRVRLFISDLLRFKLWILGLPPEDSNPIHHSDIRDDRGSNLLVDVQGSKS